MHVEPLNQTMADCVTALKVWTGKATATVVYDSTVDAFTHNGLFENVKGKRNIAIVGFTTDGDVFGGFYSKAVTRRNKGFYDPDMFAFSFESHGRCATPQRFVPKGYKMTAYVRFCNDRNEFVMFGVGGHFSLGNEKSDSWCWAMSDGFEGLERATLTGKNGHWAQGPYHHCTRLVAVRLG